MSKMDIRREALERQGSVLSINDHHYKIHGNQNKAAFEQGSEGLVHLITDQNNGHRYRLKCFWQPDENRKKRSELLVRQHLATLHKERADHLGGAPFEILGPLGPRTPFAVIMQNVDGFSWKNLKENAAVCPEYPPPRWPGFQIRATWAYGLALAVKDMEARHFVHADLSPGNVMVTPGGENPGNMALVDFDGFVHPGCNYLDTSIKGSEGYAAPELFESRDVNTGSDRIAMAVLVQEFLFVGMPEIEPDYAFRWAYCQNDEINLHKGEAHPAIKEYFPTIAHLIEETLHAHKPDLRPAPSKWLPHLFSLAKFGKPVANRLINLKLTAYPSKPEFTLSIPQHQEKTDLLNSPFRIRATIKRLPHGYVSIKVHPGGELRVKRDRYSLWKCRKGGEEIPYLPGMLIFDPAGKSTAVLEGCKND